MLRFKQTTRISASEALKSPYFANSVDCGEAAQEASLSSLSSSLTSSDTDHDSDEFDHEEVLDPSSHNTQLTTDFDGLSGV